MVHLIWLPLSLMGFPGGSGGKESACTVGDPGLILGLQRSPGEGNGSPLQYSCLENPHGQRSLEGYSPWGSQRVRHDWTVNTHAPPLKYKYAKNQNICTSCLSWSSLGRSTDKGSQIIIKIKGVRWKVQVFCSLIPKNWHHIITSLFRMESFFLRDY